MYLFLFCPVQQSEYKMMFLMPLLAISVRYKHDTISFVHFEASHSGNMLKKMCTLIVHTEIVRVEFSHVVRLAYTGFGRC